MSSWLQLRTKKFDDENKENKKQKFSNAINVDSKSILTKQFSGKL